MDINSLNLTFNFATELAYEELTATPFSPTELFDEEGNIPTRTLVNLATACIIANNPDIENPTAFLHENSRKEVLGLFTTVTLALVAWLKVPAIAESHVEEPEATEGDNTPNA